MNYLSGRNMRRPSGYNKFCHQESYIKKNPSHDINCTYIVRLFPTEDQIPIPPDKPEHSDYLL